MSPLRSDIQAFANRSSLPVIVAPNVPRAYGANIPPGTVIPVAEIVAELGLPHHNPMTPDAPEPDPTPGLLTWSGIIDSLSSGPKLPRTDGDKMEMTVPTLRRMVFQVVRVRGGRDVLH